VSNLIVAFGVVLGLGSGVECLGLRAAGPHPFAEVLLLASIGFVAAGVIGRRSEPQQARLASSVGAVLFNAVVWVLGGTFASIAVVPVILFGLLPAAVVLALVPVLLPLLIPVELTDLTRVTRVRHVVAHSHA
jgi:hypothetical protein